MTEKLFTGTLNKNQKKKKNLCKLYHVTLSNNIPVESVDRAMMVTEGQTDLGSINMFYVGNIKAKQAVS